MWLWNEPGKKKPQCVEIVEWLCGGTRAMILTKTGAKINVPVKQLTETQNYDSN